MRMFLFFAAVGCAAIGGADTGASVPASAADDGSCSVSVVEVVSGSRSIDIGPLGQIRLCYLSADGFDDCVVVTPSFVIRDGAVSFDMDGYTDGRWYEVAVVR